MIQWLKNKLFGKQPKRLELQLLPYDVADHLLRTSNGEWRIAKEEDSNFVIGLVYLEKISYD